MSFFPASKEISLNSIFIIEGYASSQETIMSFTNRAVFLESNTGEIIELSLQELHKGQMELTQAVFHPKQELKPNTTYLLKYANQTEQETNELKRLNSEENGYETIHWTTTGRKSAPSLNVNLVLEFNKTEIIHYGCGPSANAVFTIKNKSTTEVWYKTEVVDIATEKKTTFYLLDHNGVLHVGHDMCAGAFQYNDTGKYKVRFTPMNTNGIALNTTDWITFDSPHTNSNFPKGY